MPIHANSSGIDASKAMGDAGRNSARRRNAKGSLDAHDHGPPPGSSHMTAADLLAGQHMRSPSMRGSGRRDMKELHAQAQQLQAQQHRQAHQHQQPPGGRADRLDDEHGATRGSPSLHVKGGRPSSRGSDLGVDPLGDPPASRGLTSQGGRRAKGGSHHSHGPPPGSPFGHGGNGGNGMLRPSPALYGGVSGSSGGMQSPTTNQRWPGPSRGVQGHDPARDTPSRQGNRRHDGPGSQSREMPPLHPVAHPHHGPSEGRRGAPWPVAVGSGEAGLSRDFDETMDNFMGSGRGRSRDVASPETGNESNGFKASQFYVAPVPSFADKARFGGPDSRPASREAHSRSGGGGMKQMDSMGFAYHNFGGKGAPKAGRRS